MLMQCELCLRVGEEQYFERHHLKPKSSKSDTLLVCHQCGNQIHLFFENNTLTNELNTKESLRKNEKMLHYIHWVQNKPLNRSFSTAKKKKKRRR